MTKKELLEIKRTAKTACTENGIKVSMKNMVLLEYGTKNDDDIHYVMFNDHKSGIDYQCYKSPMFYKDGHMSLWYVESCRWGGEKT